MHLRLENFDGPLDLLLYLIKTQELNIFDIPIVTITEQFLNFLKQVNQLDFHEAGEYLSTAAQLIEIKTNMIFPVLQNNEADSVNTEESKQQDDPRTGLVEQLLEYQSLKKASELLTKIYEEREDVYPSNEHKRRSTEFDAFEHPIKGNSYELVIAFERVLLRFSVKKALPKVVVKSQKITIQQKMEELKTKIFTTENTPVLKDFLIECASRYELVVTIMAILELCKSRHLSVSQETHFAPIHVLKGTRFSEQISFNESQETMA